MQRKLAAILSADVAGYSRLIERDDEQAVRTLGAHRACIETLLEAHGGRLVDSPGDNLLAEFPSVIDAVRCAIAIQAELEMRNAALAVEDRMLFRMGINVGDIIIEDGRLYGDGVNIAARLEALAEAGGICLSGAVVEQIGKRVDATFEFVGEQRMKNISTPVAVWRVHRASASSNPTRDGTGKQALRRAGHRSRRRLAVGLASVAALLAVTAYLRSRDSTPPPMSAEAPVSALSASSLSTAERPAIIVLPFVNLSDDPEQAYFSDGITEDITTDLSKIDSVFVVAANESFGYKGRNVASAALRKDHGIRYRVEGSVRKSGEDVRISVRLIDIVDGSYLWSERYDRPLGSILSVQDEIRGKILTALKVKLTPEEQRRFERTRTTNLEAYDFYLRGIDLLRRSRTTLRRELMQEAIAMFDRATTADPGFALAYGRKGIAYWLIAVYHWSADPKLSLETATEFFDQAMALDPNNPDLNQFRIFSLSQTRRFDEALQVAEQWVTTQPNDSGSHRMYAWMLMYRGDYQGASEEARRAAALLPKGVLADHDLWLIGMLNVLMGKADEAVEILRSATLRAPNFISNHLTLTAAFIEAGKPTDAHDEVREILRISPDYKADNFRERLLFSDPDITERFISALKQAGLP